MIILDTNVISALMRAQPSEPALEWLNRHPRSLVWTTAITVLELRFGIEILPASRRRDTLVKAADHLIDKVLSGRVLSFGRADAGQTATLIAHRQAIGRRIEYRDAMIAGIKARGAQLATGNIKHFENVGLDLLNPWSAS